MYGDSVNIVYTLTGIHHYNIYEICSYRLQQLQINNYVEYFHTLLYLDEVVEMINLKQYNMENVNIFLANLQCIYCTLFTDTD